jgi:hypothetical protein
MIIEMRTYDVLPGTVKQVEERFAAGLPHRTEFSNLAAFWHTDVGQLNRVIHVWPYDSLDERERIRAAARDDVHWTPNISEFVVAQESKILHAAPYSPPLGERKLGDIYEIRTYTVKAGTIGQMVEMWGKYLEDRLKLSPLAAVWYSELGPLNQFIHIWPYKDAAERDRVRAESMKLSTWPPPSRQFLVKQESAIAVPASFSPLH